MYLGKELHACKKAMSDFRSIVSTIGGPSEQMRAEELCARVSVVEDRRLQGVQLSGQLKERGLVVFGTGQALRAVTVTANTAFLRAAATQVKLSCMFLHLLFFLNPSPKIFGYQIILRKAILTVEANVLQTGIC